MSSDIILSNPKNFFYRITVTTATKKETPQNTLNRNMQVPHDQLNRSHNEELNKMNGNVFTR